MLPCLFCGYRKNHRGKNDIGCCFDWNKSEKKLTDDKKFMKNNAKFPVIFDPVWGSKDCPGYSKKAVPENLVKNCLD